jgi:hypothetical protein
MRNRSKILVSDFDGTMTELDFFRVALSHLPPGAAAPWERYEQGHTSHFAALLVAPERRFVRGWLADELESRGEPFVPFTRWSDIAGCLCGGDA